MMTLYKYHYVQVPYQKNISELFLYGSAFPQRINIYIYMYIYIYIYIYINVYIYILTHSQVCS